MHEATLDILENVGVRLEHDAIVEMALRSGALRGCGGSEVRFPRGMVRDCLEQVPQTVQLSARDGSCFSLSPESEPVFWTNPAMYMWTGDERRGASVSDLAAVARLCDNLHNVHGVMGMALQDVPPGDCDFTGLRIIAENCRKHIRVLCFTGRGMDALVEMKQVFPGNWFSIGFTAHGPLRWTHLALEIFRRSSGQGIPVTINGEPMAGVTGPVSPAGSMVVGNAEILAGIIVTQLLEPGRPVIYNLGLAHTFDMRQATAVTGGPENALFARASAELGRFYGLPSGSWVSTDAVYEDEQAAMEKMFGFSSHYRHGVNLIWGMGQLESELTMSLAQLVIDDEMIDYMRHHERGFRVDAETLQRDLIREVGIAGSYLDTDHTLLHWREYLYSPRILNRKARENCTIALPGAARALVEDVLAGDSEEKIGAAEAEELRRIENRYRHA